ncbi:MAG: hypothetical protein R3327_04030 [Nitrosopumilaceae archaeon]|nr:hypothetical protein [Nitrosopumilaceae archaeon]
MALEKWIALAGLGLFAMFVGEMVSIYYFMLDAPEDLEFGIIFEPNPKILQFISIGVAPASVMSGVAFILSRRHGSKPVGSMIIAGGIILLVGMVYCNTLIDSVDDAYQTDAVQTVPPLFALLSIPVMAVGALLLKEKKKKPKKDYLT